MEKGFDALFNETYDYDIDTLSDVKSFPSDQNDLAILKALYKCQQWVFQGMLKDILSKRPELSKIDTRIACIKKANKLALAGIKAQLVELAEKPNLNALAFYVSADEKKNWSEKIQKLVSEIEKKKVKTPEEWEVVACAHIHDKVQLPYGKDESFMDIESVGISAIFEYNNYLEAFEKNSNTWKEFWLKCRLYHSTFLNTEYGKALQKAQLGYYARFFTSKERNNSDLSGYLRSSQGINTGAVPKNVLKQYSECFFSRDSIARYLCKQFKTEKDKSAEKEYMFAHALLNCSKPGFKRLGKIMLYDVAKKPLAKGKIETDNMKKPTQFFNIGLDVHT